MKYFNVILIFLLNQAVFADDYEIKQEIIKEIGDNFYIQQALNSKEAQELIEEIKYWQEIERSYKNE